MKKQYNSTFIVCTGIILAIGRIALGYIVDNSSINDTVINSPKEDAILIVMALVNYIAFGVVLFFLNKDFVKKFDERINKSGLNTNQKKDRNKAKSKLFSLFFLIYFFLGVIYVLYLKSNDLNDAISILALAISIASNGLVEDYSTQYFNYIKKSSEKNQKAQ